LTGRATVVTCERHLLHLGHRHHRADDAAHQGEKLDLAVDQHFQRRRIAGRELVVFCVDGGLHTPVGLPANRLPHGDEILVERARVRLIVILDECVVGGPHRLYDDARSGCRRSGEQRASRPGRLHRSSS
jgi:hypothetical protein